MHEEYLDKTGIRGVFNQMTINALYGQKMEKGLKCPEPVKEMLLLFWEAAYGRRLVNRGYFKELNETVFGNS